MAEEVKTTEREDKIKIADEVIATITGIAASQVDNVVSMSGSLGDGIAGMLGKKSPTKGIKGEVGEKEVALDLSIVVKYGCRIHLVAKEIQDKVRNVVEEMTGMSVAEVNINVLGVHLEKEVQSAQEEGPGEV